MAFHRNASNLQQRSWQVQSLLGACMQVVLELGPLRIPIPVRADGRGFVEWLYLDSDFRITKGNKGSVFIHTRERE